MHNATDISLKYNKKKKAFAGLLPELFLYIKICKGGVSWEDSKNSWNFFWAK